MPSAEPATDGYVLALEEARRTLDAQERAVAQLSVRAGLLISSAAIVTSFLGGPVLARSDIDLAAWLAIGAFIAVTGTVLAVLRPQRTLEFALHPAPVVKRFVELPRASQPTNLRRELALHMGRSIDRNAREISTMMTSFHIASLLLAIEIGAWVVSIATVR
jgi:hypothetical protein